MERGNVLNPQAGMNMGWAYHGVCFRGGDCGSRRNVFEESVE